MEIHEELKKTAQKQTGSGSVASDAADNDSVSDDGSDVSSDSSPPTPAKAVKRLSEECHIKNLKGKLCRRYLRSRSVETLANLIRLFPCANRLRYDTFLEKHIILPEGAVVWTELNVKPIWDEVVPFMKAHMRELYQNNDDSDAEETNEQLRMNVSLEKVSTGKSKITEAVEVLCKDDVDDSRRGHCALHVKGWRLLLDDKLALLNFDQSGHLQAQYRDARAEDHFVDSMCVKMTSKDVQRVVSGQVGLTNEESELMRVMGNTWIGPHADDLFRYEHAKRAQILWMTDVVRERKIGFLTVSESDTGKDVQHNAMRQLAPGLVDLIDEKYIYGEDKSKLADQGAHLGYFVMTSHTEIDVDRIDRNKYRARYGNVSESATRKAHSTDKGVNSKMPIMQAYANWDTFNKPIPPAVIPKIGLLPSVLHDSNGEQVCRTMRRFADENGNREDASETDKPYLAPVYREEAPWEHATTYGSMQLSMLRDEARSYAEKNPGRTWNVISGQPDILKGQVVNYQLSLSCKRRRVGEGLSEAPQAFYLTGVTEEATVEEDFSRIVQMTTNLLTPSKGSITTLQVCPPVHMFIDTYGPIFAVHFEV